MKFSILIFENQFQRNIFSMLRTISIERKCPSFNIIKELNFPLKIFIFINRLLPQFTELTVCCKFRNKKANGNVRHNPTVHKRKGKRIMKKICSVFLLLQLLLFIFLTQNVLVIIFSIYFSNKLVFPGYKAVSTILFLHWIALL